MAHILITYTGQRWMKRLPRLVLINGRPIGLMQTGSARLTLPAGNYMLTIQFGGPIALYPRSPKTRLGRWLQDRHWQPDMSVGATEAVHLDADSDIRIQYADKEKIWNILFDIDLLLWIIGLFVHIPSPWGLIYHLVSDIFFVIWLVRLYLVRKRYYRMTITHATQPTD